ncbi:MAG: hypothetical protein ACXQTP_04580 [Candidatus Methanofastidiosia archaeon]
MLKLMDDKLLTILLDNNLFYSDLIVEYFDEDINDVLNFCEKYVTKTKIRNYIIISLIWIVNKDINSFYIIQNETYIQYYDRVKNLTFRICEDMNIQFEDILNKRQIEDINKEIKSKELSDFRKLQMIVNKKRKNLFLKNTEKNFYEYHYKKYCNLFKNKKINLLKLLNHLFMPSKIKKKCSFTKFIKVQKYRQMDNKEYGRRMVKN